MDRGLCQQSIERFAQWRGAELLPVDGLSDRPATRAVSTTLSIMRAVPHTYYVGAERMAGQETFRVVVALDQSTLAPGALVGVGLDRFVEYPTVGALDPAHLGPALFGLHVVPVQIKFHCDRCDRADRTFRAAI